LTTFLTREYPEKRKANYSQQEVKFILEHVQQYKKETLLSDTNEQREARRTKRANLFHLPAL
jgi:hypothetical protein